MASRGRSRVSHDLGPYQSVFPPRPQLVRLMAVVHDIRRVFEQSAHLPQGVRLFTVGISAPHYDWDAVTRWLQWRDAKNA